MEDKLIDSVGKVRFLRVNGVSHIKWDIEKYVKLCEGKDDEIKFTSPSFEILSATWNFVLYPFDPIHTGRPGRPVQKSVSIFLAKKNSDIEDHTVQYKLEMKVHEKVLKSFFSQNCFKVNSEDGKRDFLRVANIEFLVPEDTVSVFLFIYPADSTIQQLMNRTGSTDMNSEGTDTLLTNLEDLYLNQRDCDLKIRVKTREFGVHKTILAARSPVFYAMLHNDMAENNTGVVNIVDFEPGIFDHFLLYLYTGQVYGFSWTNIFKLYALGDKYGLQCLKKECLKYMMINICVDTFCEVFDFSMKHEESTLLKRAEDFFLKNIELICRSKGWKEYMIENPALCNDLFMKNFSK